MINNVTLVGRLTKDVELKHLQNQNKTAYAQITLAVARDKKNKNGERVSDFISCISFGKTAENLAQWAQKGALIGVTGRIQTRNYENQQGQRVYVTEIVIASFYLLESKNKNQGQNQQSQPNLQNQGGYNGQQNQGNYNGNYNQGGPQNNGYFDPSMISDDDLPF